MNFYGRIRHKTFESVEFLMQLCKDTKGLEDKQGLSIIIPTFNRAELLRKALESIQALHIPEGWSAEVLVIDNNSTDHTANVAEDIGQRGPIPLRCVVETQQGLNHGRNRGLEEARFEHLVYLDDDMTVDPGWLEGYIEAQEIWQPDAVVGPVDPLFEHPPMGWMTPRMIESVTSAYSQKGDKLIVVPAHRAHELPGCNFGVRRDAAFEAGGFHPALDRCGAGMLAGGDWEFGEKLVQLNKQVVYSPRCRIQHLISRKKLSREGLRARWKGNGATMYALKLLRGDDLSSRRRLHLFLRMIRLFGRSLHYRIIGKDALAFRWELEALLLYGLLFKAPHGLQQRKFPLVGLQVGSLDD